VLRYLKENGPLDYNILYVHFDENRSGEIATVLNDLLQWKHIERVGNNVGITDLGVRTFQDGEYWK
jgi:hypothetical protein